MGLINTRLGNIDLDIPIIVSISKGWHDLGMRCFVLSHRFYPLRNGQLDALNLGLSASAQKPYLAAITASTQALDSNWQLNVTELSNNASVYKSYSQKNKNLWSWALYRAALALWVEPHKTWVSYSTLLTAAEELSRNELYLGTYFLGRDLDSPLIKETHRAHIRVILKSQLTEDPFPPDNIPDCAYLVHMARALGQEAESLANELDNRDPGHLIFELLYRVEGLRETTPHPDEGFSTHASPAPSPRINLGRRLSALSLPRALRRRKIRSPGHRMEHPGTGLPQGRLPPTTYRHGRAVETPWFHHGLKQWSHCSQP